MTNKSSRLKYWLPLIGACFTVGGMWTGYLLAGGDNISPAQQKLSDVFDLLENDYVDDISTDSLVEMTLPQLLKNLDPHTVYIPVSELDHANRDLESSFYGIGAQTQLLSDSVCVVEVIPGGPAQRAGILPGDRIVAINGKPIEPNITTDKMESLLRGAKDSKVKVQILRPSKGKLVTYNLVRGEIPVVSIDASYIMDGDIGYIRLSKFAPKTYNEFAQALSNLQARGAKSFILDLRGNLGGLLPQAIMVANEFLQPSQAIVETRGRKSSDNEYWMADGTGSFTDQDLVVLVDEFTASSSEIVAGAIQDNDRGLILGRRSFGKGLVQRVITLPDSSQLRLTVQRYFTPSGRCIQKDFTRGDNDKYDKEIVDRYSSGEVFNADSIKFKQNELFTTKGGRKVYGGGGITPDVFVPSDTTGLTSYFFQVSNAGLLNKFAYEYADLNREELTKSKNIDQLLAKLPSREVLLWSFVKYAADNGIPRRWYYINNSASLIVNQLKALIARDILGLNAYYEVLNRNDNVVSTAIKEIRKGIGPTLNEPTKNSN